MVTDRVLGNPPLSVSAAIWDPRRESGVCSCVGWYRGAMEDRTNGVDQYFKEPQATARQEGATTDCGLVGARDCM